MTAIVIPMVVILRIYFAMPNSAPQQSIIDRGKRLPCSHTVEHITGKIHFMSISLTYDVCEKDFLYFQKEFSNLLLSLQLYTTF